MWQRDSGAITKKTQKLAGGSPIGLLGFKFGL